jgi:hypothetical protein
MPIRFAARAALPCALAALAALLALGACGHGKTGTRTTPQAPPMARQGQDALVDDAWGVGLLVDPATTTTDVSERRFAVETLSHGDLGAGVFKFTVDIDPARAQAGSLDLARAERESWMHGGGSELSDVSEVKFLGRAGHAFTFRDPDSFGLDVVTVWGKCVFNLVVMRAGRPEWMTEYASAVLRNIKSMTGAPVDPARCK